MKYDDILYMHPELKHRRMPRAKRAAQFSPFAALTGYDDAIKDASRTTSQEALLSDDMAEDISKKLLSLQESPRICKIIYFKDDLSKPGGEYVCYEGVFKRIELGYILFEDKTKIEVNKLFDIIL